MGFFSRNKNNGFTVNTDTDNKGRILGNKNLAPHAITPDELSDSWVMGDNSYRSYSPDGPSPLDKLKKKMNIEDEASLEQESIADSVKELLQEKSANQAVQAQKDINSDDNIKATKSLLEKLQPYTVDEQGHDLSKSNEPLYQLESVAEILKSNSEKALKDLSEKYDVFVDDLSHTKTSKTTDEHKSVKKTPVAFEPITEPTDAFKQMVIDAEAREEKELMETLFPEDKATVTSDISMPDISDIDNSDVGGSKNEGNISNTATIRFTPVKNSKGNTDHITISNTRHIDLSSDVQDENSNEITTTKLDQSEFERFVPKQEMTDLESGKKLLRRFAVKKRSGFLRLLVSSLITLSLLLFLIPALSNFIISNTQTAMIICGAFLSVSVLCNFDMVLDFAKLSKKRCSSDILAFTVSVFVLALTVYSAIADENSYYIILLCSVILWFRAFTEFKKASYLHGNLKQLVTDTQKNAVTLIGDSATTFAMAKNSIEGDVLVAAHRKTNFAEDFMKYSAFSSKLSGKLSLVFCFTLLAAVISGVAAFFYYDSLFDAFYSAACIACIAALPTVFLIDALPLSSAAKGLNWCGAMIAGLSGAEQLENANAAVLSTNDIFPHGTITLQNMKVLHNNNIDEILVRAASLTDAVSSPLAGIFKEIVGTNNSYSIPNSDTVKYEKRLGISGWVDNELLFIGNRSLMEAHGITIPSIEIDKKILRKGFFPVYVATQDTACALIVIQYNVDPKIAKQLHKITSLGITLLIENCDQNINEEMICDYFDLYDDSVKIMSNAGVHMYKNATTDTERCSSPAYFKGSTLNFLKIINCASAIRRSNYLLSIMYLVLAVIGAVYFLYAAFSGLQAMPTPSTILIAELIATALSIIGFLIRKP